MKSGGLQLEVEVACTGCRKIIKVPRGIYMNGMLCDECKE